MYLPLFETPDCVLICKLLYIMHYFCVLNRPVFTWVSVKTPLIRIILGLCSLLKQYQ